MEGTGTRRSAFDRVVSIGLENGIVLSTARGLELEIGVGSTRLTFKDTQNNILASSCSGDSHCPGYRYVSVFCKYTIAPILVAGCFTYKAL
jgi:hypothetical protein